MDNKLKIDLLAYAKFEEQLKQLNELILHGSSPADPSNPDHRLMLKINEAFTKFKQTKTITIDDFLNAELSLATELLLSKFTRVEPFVLPIVSSVNDVNPHEPTARDHFQFVSVGEYKTGYSGMIRLVRLRLLKAEEIVDASAVEKLIHKYHLAMVSNRQLRAEYRELLKNKELRSFFHNFDYPTVDGRDLDPVIQLEFADRPFQVSVVNGNIVMFEYDCRTLGSSLELLNSLKVESDLRTDVVREQRDSDDNPNPSFAILEEVDVKMIESNPFYSFIWRSGDSGNKIARCYDLHLPQFFITENMSSWNGDTIRAIDANLEFIRNFGKYHSFIHMRVTNDDPLDFQNNSFGEYFEYKLSNEKFWFRSDLEIDRGEGHFKFFEGHYPNATFAQLVPLVKSQLDGWFSGGE